MIIKEKRWLSRIVAMLCVLTMVVGVLTPASIGVAAGNLGKKIIIPIVEGIDYWDVDDGYMNDIVDEDDYRETSGYKYKKSNDGANIEIVSLDGEGSNFGSAIKFMIYADSKPNVSVKETGKAITPRSMNGGWLYTLSSTQFGTNETITLVIKKQVVFNIPKSNTGEYSISNVKCADKNVTGNTITAVVDDKVSFEVSINNNDDNSKELDVYAYGKKLELKDSTYEFNVEENDPNIFINVKTKTFTVTGPENPNSDEYLYIQNSSSTTITYGGNFSFNVSPKAGYEAPTVSINPSDAGTLINNGNIYNITNISKNLQIIIERGKSEQCDVIFEGSGYSITAGGIENGYKKVNYGTELPFSIKPDEGYTISRVTANGTVLTPVTPTPEPTADQIYSYKTTITGNTTIAVTVKKLSFDITYTSKNNDEDKAFLLTEGVKKAEYGDTCTFYVVPKPGYGTPTVTVNGIALNPVNGTQYVTTITQKTDIVITAPAEKIQCKITYNDAEGCDFETAPNEVPYGENLTFTLEVEKHYSDSKPVVSVDGKNQPAPTPSADPEGKKTYQYTVSGITSDQIVTVSGIQKNTYKVTLPASDPRYTVTTNDVTNVIAESSFTFHVSINSGYKKGKDFKVVANGQKLEDIPTGDYTIKSVESDTTIEIEDVEELTYTVTKGNDSHSTITNTAGTEQLEAIKYGDPLKFKVSVATYYHLTQVAVDGVEVNPVGDVYTVLNITNNPVITVTTAPNELTVKYVDTKYPKNNETKVYTKEGDNLIKTVEPEKNSVYKFNGWKGDTGENVNSIDITQIENKASAEITLTASWGLDETVLQRMITLQTDKSTADGKATFKTMIKVIEDAVGNLPSNEKDKIKVSALGTLFSNKAINSDEINSNKEKIKSSLSDVGVLDSTGYTRVKIDDNMFNYYWEGNYKIGELDNTYYRLIIKGADGDNYNGLGWIQLDVDGEKMILVANLS